MVKVGIAGGSGYGGTELIHILLRHPHVDIAWVSSQQHVGKAVAELYPHLRGFLDHLKFSAVQDVPASSLDLLFLALPHGHAMKMVPGLPDRLAVIDLSGDFRISDPAVFEEYYGIPLEDPEVQKRFVYGLPEINREDVRRARYVSNPGCFATATILALYPLVKGGWVEGPVFVDTKTGSSGAGNSPTAGTHHPRRTNSLFPYKPFRHQHLPEIVQALGHPANRVVFQTYSAPFVRGIFASHYMTLRRPASPEEVRGLFMDHYGSEPFIRWVADKPDVNYVRHSNFTDIGAAVDGTYLIVWSVLDNLQKGAAGQAVQNMNIMCGFPEGTGLNLAPVHP
ncbi:MAG: N-acetyl-gamma-glutamyl-phosphate reductase [Acidobacteria bacterium]|nr:MAG: N-acetyl-gamma-glutamyl-phosphate reductase [Acidobacteriota bacterium]